MIRAATFARRYPIGTVGRFFGTVNISLPDLGEGTKEATIKEIFVEEGQRVEEFDNLCEVFTDKLVAPIPSTSAGIIKKINFVEEDVCLVGSILIEIENDEDDEIHIGEDPGRTKHVEEEPVPAFKPKEKRLSPAAARYIRMYDLSWDHFEVTNRFGIITKADIIQYLKENPELKEKKGIQEERAARVPTFNAMHEAPDLSDWAGGDKIMSVDYDRVLTTTESNYVPFFVYSDDFDVTTLHDLGMDSKREQALFVKAVSRALEKFPLMNSHFNAQTDDHGYIKEYVIKKSQDISIGWVVLEDAASKTIGEITDALTTQSSAVAPASFTIVPMEAGVKMYGNIVPPQTVIMTIGKNRVEGEYGETGDIEKRVKRSITFTCDHRIVDGATCAQFSEEVKGVMESPESLLINLPYSFWESESVSFSSESIRVPSGSGRLS